MTSTDTDRQDAQQVDSLARSQLKGHLPAVLWFTGLSGSGKTTLANAVESRLVQEFRAHTYFLDGDIVRTGLSKDLDFSPTGRSENIRRIGEVSRLFYDAGLIVLTAFISPYRSDRAVVRDRIPAGGFVEIFVRCPLEVCEQRDPKGNYRKARAGLIRGYTGIDSPYEEPENPELILDTSQNSIEICTNSVIQYLLRRQIIK